MYHKEKYHGDLADELHYEIQRIIAKLLKIEKSTIFPFGPLEMQNRRRVLRTIIQGTQQKLCLALDTRAQGWKPKCLIDFQVHCMKKVL